MMRILGLLVLIFFLGLAVSAAPVTIDSSPHTSVDRHRKNMVAFPSDQVGYVFYADSSEDLVYKKTTDGGATWGSKVTLVSSADSLGPIIWYDKWTPGDTGSKIHILYIGESNDDLYYIEFETSTDTASTEEIISGAHTSATYDDDNRYYITKSNTGVLYVAAIDDTTSGTFAAKCSATCTTGANWSDTTGSFPFTDDDDEDILIMPLDNGDLIALNWDISENKIYSSKYNADPDTWATKALVVNSIDSTSYRSAWGAVVNPSNFLVHLIVPEQTYANTDSYRFEYYNDTWTQNGNILNNNADISSYAVAVDGSNGDFYVTFFDQNSTDITMYEYDGVTDAGVSNYLYSTSDDYRAISMNLVNDERIYGAWFNDTSNTLMGMTLSDLVASIRVTSFSPIDNGFLAGLDSNLSILFNRAVDIQTGDLVIKKASDDSVIETISVAGAQVTGNGNSTIYIDPSVSLEAATQYYVEIDSAAFLDLSANSFAGFTDNGTWNFTTSSWSGFENWLYRLKITIDADQISANLTDFPIYINLADLNGTSGFFENVKSDGGDIRVTKSDGSTEVAREIVSLSTTSNTGEMHFVADGTLSSSSDTDFYLYYGNTSASDHAVTATYGAENVWGSSSYGVWHFDEDPDGAVLTDSTSNSNDGTPQNLSSEDPVAGLVGNAWDFDGSAEYVDVAVSMTSENSVSFIAVVNVDSVGTYVSVMETRDSGLSGLLFSGAGGNPLTGTWDNAEFNTDTSLDPTTSSWYMYGLSVSSSDMVNYLHNGSTQSTYELSGANTARSFTDWDIARDPGYSGRYLDGRIDELRVIDASLSASYFETLGKSLLSSSSFYSLGSQEVGDFTASSFSPADDNASAGLNANLIVGFNKTIDIQTGNLYIKKLSDDSVVETIAITSLAVTGNGTTTLTIDPAASFVGNTDYYITIDSTAIDSDEADDYAGITDNGTWNFTTSSWSGFETWSNRIKITIDADQVAADLTNFPVYINLADFNGTAGFFENVKSDGGDIRMTKSDGTTELAREIVAISTTSNTGEMHFVANGTLSSSSDTDFYLYYGNAAVSDHASSDTYGAQNVWIEDYSGIWHFEEEVTNASDEVLESSSAAAHGTSTGMASDDDVAAQLGKGLSMDGSDDKVVMSGFTGPATSITTSIWYNPTTLNGGQDVILQGSSSADYYIRMETYSNKQRSFYSDGVTWSSYVSGTTTLSTGTWYYGVGTGTATTINTYLDGSLETSSSTSRTPAASSGIVVGAWYTTNSYNFPGVVDELRISSVVRSADWISTEYNNQSSSSSFYSAASPETATIAATVFSPVDNSTTAGISQNLVITFSEIWDSQTGFIKVKKNSENLLVENLDILGSRITGNGTTTLTIDPGNNLHAGTPYYVTIDSTALANSTGDNYAGISSTTQWNFTTNSWYGNNWPYRVKVTVDADMVNGDLTDFPVYIDLSDFNGTAFFNQVQADGDDIRLTKMDGTTELPYELVTIDTVDNGGELHFKADGTLSSSADTSFYVYYGNSTASAYSNGDSYGSDNVWTQGFLAVFHLGEDGNTSAGGYIDSSINSNDGTGVSMTSSSDLTGVMGMAQDFDGTSDYIDAGSIYDISDVSAAPFSITVWANADVSAGDAQSLCAIGSTDYNAFSYEWDSAEKLYLIADTTGTFNWDILNKSTSASSLNTWVYTAATRDTSGNHEMYFDGASAGGSFTNASDIFLNSSVLKIGAHYSLNTSYMFNGTLDELRIANEVRSSDWISAEYNNQNSPSTFYAIQDEANPPVYGIIPGF
jgi:hypothetical protein